MASSWIGRLGFNRISKSFQMAPDYFPSIGVYQTNRFHFGPANRFIRVCTPKRECRKLCNVHEQRAAVSSRACICKRHDAFAFMYVDSRRSGIVLRSNSPVDAGSLIVGPTWMQFCCEAWVMVRWELLRIVSDWIVWRMTGNSRSWNRLTLYSREYPRS